MLFEHDRRHTDVGRFCQELCFQVDYGEPLAGECASSSMTRIYQTRFLCHRRRFLTPSRRPIVRPDHGQCFGFPAMRFHVETYPEYEEVIIPRKFIQ
ncbi:uncharacterized protein LOC122533571 isoform X3 [Frieseomelitta varia]|uniref:uncharacterized protein LOC122533571 isoform X3 n=1 Tax=Frieseomelitta varia TaxID=561572 RepID=UPI001CB6A1CB|nr:uncharacterized protein LOC122533571 isoform X3 [Frieseomelitta varia]